MATVANIPDGSMSDVVPSQRVINHKRSMSDIDQNRPTNSKSTNPINQDPTSDSLYANSFIRENQRPRIIREGSMVRFGRRKYGRSFMHNRHFVLEPTRLSYYKKKPSEDQVRL